MPLDAPHNSDLIVFCKKLYQDQGPSCQSWIRRSCSVTKRSLSTSGSVYLGSPIWAGFPLKELGLGSPSKLTDLYCKLSVSI